MDILSAELKAIITGVAGQSDLLNLRRTSKSLSSPATERLFSQVHVTPKEESQERYQRLVNSSLAALVTSVKLTTSNEPYKDRSEEESDFTEEFEECFRSLNRFPNLRDIIIESSVACMVDDDPDDAWAEDVEESVSFRYDVLNALFETLNDVELPVAKLRSLTLKNLQNYNHEDLVKSLSFAGVLSRLSELRLKIVTEYETSSPETNWSVSQMHTFFAELPSIWLKPTVQNLTSLCIHADIFWGYLPLCDFRTVHFPKLKKLEFGNYSFSHGWQLDWILSHKTLEELTLDDCHIVNYIYGFGEIDHEKYPRTPAIAWGDTHMWEYDAQWSQYFDAIRIGLSRLRSFMFGSGDWEQGKNFDGGARWTSGAHEEMYMIFNRGIGPAPWGNIARFRGTLSEGWSIEIRDRLVDSVEEDERALKQLMDVVTERVRSLPE